MAHGLYGFIEWISRQIIIDTAEAEFLERWASIWRVQRLTATPATGTITFTVAPNAADIPVGTLVQTLDGTQFQTTADITVSGLQATTSRMQQTFRSELWCKRSMAHSSKRQPTSQSVGSRPRPASVTAVVPSAASNNYAGQTVNLVTPVLGVQTTAVLGALSGGGDRELDDSLREKLL
ncbi:baseplate J/gp47 family protein, partial [Xanthomonas sp. MUS 060]|uniref:baseplate J/gp47 family protein n=1 Tax=Xanthomonas sp. MUS 060 TaxID=1588031 RepID=UPI001F2F2BA1